MADILIDTMINQILVAMEDNVSLLLDIQDHVDDLVEELKSFNAFVKEAAAASDDDDDNKGVKDAVGEVRALVSDAEDAIHKYVIEKQKHKSKGSVIRYIEKVAYYTKVNAAAKDIESIRQKVGKIRQHHAYTLRPPLRYPDRDQTPSLHTIVRTIISSIKLPFYYSTLLF